MGVTLSAHGVERAERGLALLQLHAHRKERIRQRRVESSSLALAENVDRCFQGRGKAAQKTLHLRHPGLREEFEGAHYRDQWLVMALA